MSVPYKVLPTYASSWMDVWMMANSLVRLIESAFRSLGFIVLRMMRMVWRGKVVDSQDDFSPVNDGSASGGLIEMRFQEAISHLTAPQHNPDPFRAAWKGVFACHSDHLSCFHACLKFDCEVLRSFLKTFIALQGPLTR